MTRSISPYLNAVPRSESELRARAFLPPLGPEFVTGCPPLDDDLRALFDNCNLWGQGDSRTISALLNTLSTFRWRETPPRKTWGDPKITETQKARAREIVTGWLELARKKP